MGDDLTGISSKTIQYTSQGVKYGNDVCGAACTMDGGVVNTKIVDKLRFVFTSYSIVINTCIDKII
jgi:hypothetical protein